MLPVEWLERFLVMPGQVAVRRDERVTNASGLVLLVDSQATQVKSSLATVERVGEGVIGLSVGDRVLVGSGVGRKVVFGERNEHELYICRPEELLVKVHEATEGEELPPDLQGSHRTEHEVQAQLEEQKVDEGYYS